MFMEQLPSSAVAGLPPLSRTVVTGIVVILFLG